MSHIPSELKYASSHEWARLESDGTVTVGVTFHAQELLGDIVYVEVPAEGREVSAGEAVSVVESVKAASDVYAPIAGTVVASNAALSASPETINADPYQAGWMFRLQPKNAADLAQLLTAEAYAQSL